MKPLEGLKVLDMTHVLAGPYCTYQLGLLGAEVIKIESPVGDMTRIWGGTPEQIDSKMGTGFIPQNAGKKSVVIDMNREEGSDLIRKLATEVDILVENYRPGVLKRNDLGYEDIRALNPNIIYLSITAFGQNGPHGQRPGFDDVIQATSGYMANNVRGDGPIRTGGPVLDYATGMHAASSVLAAVLVREKTGEGTRIDLAMQDVAMLLINRNVSYTATTGDVFTPAGNRDDFLNGRFATGDGYVMLAGYLPRHQRSILRSLGLDELAELSGRELRQRAEEVTRAAEEILVTKTSDEWDQVFSEQQVVAGGVRDLQEVMHTGQPEARLLLSEVESSVGDVQVTNAGYLFDGQEFQPDGGLPVLGADTQAVLTGAGISDEQIAELSSSGVIGLG